ncbi:MAG TPA: hypothetical protein VNZ57_09895 [Longimicrobiales bacterium]|nr:hypothetical protein [Longimicrobiales bacterium]
MAHDVSISAPPLRVLDAAPRKVSKIILVLLGFGVVSLISALLVDAPRAWRAYTYNWLFWTSIAQGAVMIAVMVSMARGVWSRPVRRIALSFVAFLPVAFVLFLPILFVGHHIFPWVGEDLHGKEVWLNLPFIGARNLILLAILFAMSLRYAYWSIRPDLGELRQSAPANRQGLYERLTSGWRGQAEEERIAARKVARLGPALGLVFALAFSMLAWDYVMALDYHWFSTLIGPYFFMGGVLGGVAVTSLAVMIYRNGLGLHDVIQSNHLHDLGKLTFGFCIFWAYMFWSQFLVIWYGMLPHDQSFVVDRFSAPFLAPALLVFACLFVIPFFGLLGVKPKRTPAIFGTFASIILFGLWIERFVLVYPANYAHAESLPFGWIEIGTSFVFAGLFLASLMFFATRFPLFQRWLSSHEHKLLDPTYQEPA